MGRGGEDGEWEEEPIWRYYHGVAVGVCCTMLIRVRMSLGSGDGSVETAMIKAHGSRMAQGVYGEG